MWVLVEEGVTYCSYVAPSTFAKRLSRISALPPTSRLDGAQRSKASSQKRRAAIVLQGERSAQSLL
jgi:hypothetical protein